MPRVAVVIPSYNHEKFVAEAIQSVLDQTFQDFEIVITDDGSTDNTVDEILQFDDPRIKFFKFEENQGAVFAFEKCLSNVSDGVEYIANLSSDDIFMPDKLQKQVDFLDDPQNEKYAAVFGFAEIIDEDGEIIRDKNHPYVSIFKQYNRSRYEWLNYFFFNGNCLCHPSVLIRKEFYKIDDFDPRYRQLPDFDFWIKLCFKAEIFIIPENLIRFRVLKGEKNTSGSGIVNDSRVRFENLQILSNYRNIETWEIFNKIFSDEIESDKTNKDILYNLSQVSMKSANDVVKFFGLTLLFENFQKFRNLNSKEKITYNDLHNKTWSNQFHIASTDSLQLYFDNGSGFSHYEMLERPIDCQLLNLDFDEADFNAVKQVRIVPGNNKCVISVRKISIVNNIGQETIINNYNSNATYFEENRLFFFLNSPFIEFKLNKHNIVKIVLSIYFHVIGNEDILPYLDYYYNEKLKERDKIITETINRKSHEVTQKNQEIQQKNQEIQQKNQEIQQKNSEIHYITSRLSYRIVNRLSKLRLVLFFYHIAKFILKIPFKLVKKIKKKNSSFSDSYSAWIKHNEPDIKSQKLQKIHTFEYSPLISIIVPIYNTPPKLLKEMIESVLNQTYSKWELCLSVAGDIKQTKKIINTYAKKYKNIKVVYLEENLGIAGNTNKAIELSNGEFIGLLDHDDTIAPFALFEIVRALNVQKYDVIYSDEDKITYNGKVRKDPAFKPDFSPDYLRGINYICHFLVIRKELGDTIGWFRDGFNGAQDHDLILRLIDETNNIGHVSKILYHWRESENSTSINPNSKPYANESGIKAVKEHLHRNNIKGDVVNAGLFFHYKINYDIIGNPKVTIIIPNKDNIDILDVCVKSILNKSRYGNYDILIVENNSTETATFEYYNQIKETYSNIDVITYPDEFNYSRINNFAARHSSGEYLLFLNNDTEVISNDWIERLLEYTQRSDVGITGSKLYYPDDTIQHGGVIVGIAGSTGHSFLNMPKESYGYSSRLITVQNYSAVTAACMMMRKEVFNEINGFDEQYAIAYNDMDLCLRVREKGYLIVWTPFSELYHHECKTRGYNDTLEKQSVCMRETDLFMRRWHDILDSGDPYYNKNLSLKKYDFSIKERDEY
jgi:glycosyltransferase involved in cell wall biosynthesis